MKRKLFCSFTGTLMLIESGHVTDEELACGLFAYGCSRAHAFNPEQDKVNEVTWLRDSTPEQQTAIHQRLVQALIAAEESNRVAWRTEEESGRVALVNKLLVAHNYKPLQIQEWEFSHPGLRDAVAINYDDLVVATQ